MPVKKKNGKWRMCIDFTDLNKACPKDDFPLPRIDKIVDDAANSQLMSLLDCFSGYHQIWMRMEDEEKTSFTTPFRHLLLRKNARRSQKCRPVILKDDLQSPRTTTKKKYPNLRRRYCRHQRRMTRSHLRSSRNLRQPPEGEPEPQPRKMCFLECTRGRY